MARTAIPVQALSVNAGTVNAGTALDPTNGMYIPASAFANRGRFLLHVLQTGGTAGTVSVLPGDNPPAFRAAGTLTVVVPATTGSRLFLIETAAYAQDDQTINIDLSASSSGTAVVYTLPKDF
jgi:hypothetical protein